MKTTMLALLLMLAFTSHSQTEKNNGKMDSGYAPVNGLKMYYEIYGSGSPLVLIHGGNGAIEMWGPVLPLLAQQHKVIAVDLQAHGRTADINRPLSFDSMAADITGVLKYLKIDKADIMGYSLGGGVALRTALLYPDVVNKLVLVSTPYARNGWYPEILQQMKMTSAASAEMMKQTPMYQLYSAIAPRPEDWPVLFTKMGVLLNQDYDWSAQVKQMKMPTLLVAGDADAVQATHILGFFKLLGGAQKDANWDNSGRPASQLAILPGQSHYTIFSSPALASAVLPFIEKK